MSKLESSGFLSSIFSSVSTQENKTGTTTVEDFFTEEEKTHFEDGSKIIDSIMKGGADDGTTGVDHIAAMTHDKPSQKKDGVVDRRFEEQSSERTKEEMKYMVELTQKIISQIPEGNLSSIMKELGISSGLLYDFAETMAKSENTTENCANWTPVSVENTVSDTASTKTATFPSPWNIPECVVNVRQEHKTDNQIHNLSSTVEHPYAVPKGIFQQTKMPEPVRETYKSERFENMSKSYDRLYQQRTKEIPMNFPYEEEEEKLFKGMELKNKWESLNYAYIDDIKFIPDRVDRDSKEFIFDKIYNSDITDPIVIEMVKIYVSELDWSKISSIPRITSIFIDMFIDNIDWESLSKNNAAMVRDDYYIMTKYSEKIGWNNISKNVILSDSFLERFKQSIDWNSIVENNSLQEYSIINYSECIDWELLGQKNKRLTDNFIRQNITKLKLSRERIEEVFKNLIVPGFRTF